MPTINVKNKIKTKLWLQLLFIWDQTSYADLLNEHVD